MSAKILDGKAIAQDIRAELKARTAELKTQGIVPGLGVLLVGDDPASRSYVTAKEKACEETGLYSREIKLPATASHKEILDVVKAFNADEKIDGILVQLPLPDSSMEQSVIEAINPDK
ncbi:MAG TPA: tetrahydrofolate dehydrogenase/cyclohydrolase catalytic domain-containing protein, partial [Pontiellaceae bacterium]|nr:tetrahydrofolate dehydrogenase/cyclohydrolase catalytic domain-containing protein [Pontiellaceae bacterium]